MSCVSFKLFVRGSEISIAGVGNKKLIINHERDLKSTFESITNKDIYKFKGQTVGLLNKNVSFIILISYFDSSPSSLFLLFYKVTHNLMPLKE